MRANANRQLKAYRDKRDTGASGEPGGSRADEARAVRSAASSLAFVVQRHAARQLHYDFRLEMDGVLTSWAIPKGPSLDPTVKRMAVHVEDHPLSYAGFEGVIPPGHYGAGSVTLWDEGQWIPEGNPRSGLREGKLKFELRGHKLQGHWTLIRMRDPGRGKSKATAKAKAGSSTKAQAHEAWLLIKDRDDSARAHDDFDITAEEPESVPTRQQSSGRTKSSTDPSRPNTTEKAAPVDSVARSKTPFSTSASLGKRAKLPLKLTPQLATLVNEVPAQWQWEFEAKFDGYRILARIEGRKVQLVTRNGRDWTSKLKRLAAALANLGVKSAWLDGEIVVNGPRGAPDFQRLQNAFDASRTEEIQYFVFDLPFLNGRDLRDVVLCERRSILHDLLKERDSGDVHFSPTLKGPPQSLLTQACDMGMEGVIGKRVDSLYVSRRAPSWIKLKCKKRQEFVVVGYTEPRGSRTGLGSLLLAVHDKTGELRYTGNVGTGFAQSDLSSLTERFKSLRASQPTVKIGRSPMGVHWLRPRLVAEVSFAEWTQSGLVRQAVYHGLRNDKPAAAIGLEMPVETSSISGRAPSRSSLAAQKKGAAKSIPAALLPKGVRLTHGERVIDPQSGATKAELMVYYAAASRHILPQLCGRAVSLMRAPDGVEGEHFFQKHADGLAAPKVTLLNPKLHEGHAPLIAIDDEPALFSAVQMNAVEFHAWNSLAKHIDLPDRMIFDLDPGEGVAWSKMQEAAQLVRALLSELGLQSLLKTSGGKGLHVVVPLRPTLHADAVKTVSRAIVEHLAATFADRFVAKSGARHRVGKIYVDYLRNGWGATTVCAWSVRARPGLGVSVPVAWEELEGLTSGAHWTLRSVKERLSTPDPWEFLAKTRQGLRKAIKILRVNVGDD